MVDWFLSNEVVARLLFFVPVFAGMAAWELVAARRRLTVPKRGRWTANLGLVAFNALLLRLLFPTATVGVAWFADERGWGLFNHVHPPAWVAVVAAVVVLDFVVYVQHVVFHIVPILWRLHMVHHADLDLDVTSGARFHTVEMALSMVVKLAVVVALGAPPIAAFTFEVLLNATAMFNHSNVRLAVPLDRVLRWLVVTPDMHRVHHSVARAECNSNFGFNLPWWDRLLGTYRAQPDAGHEAMVIGLEHLQQPRRQTLAWMLALPFVGSTGGYPPRHGAGAGTSMRRQSPTASSRTAN